MKTPQKLLLAFAFSTLVAGAAIAQFPISVNAGANGFTGWTEQNTGSTSGRFTGSANSTLNTNGVSWGLYANSGNTSANIYQFGSNLPVGGFVEIGVSLGNIDSGGTVGFSLRNSSGTNRFESYYVGNSTDSFKLNDQSGQEDVTGPTTSWTASSWSNSNYQTIRFTLGASNAYTLSFNNTPVTNSGLSVAASDISEIRIFNFNAGSGSASDQYFNSLTVVPEPSTYALIALGAAFVLWRVRRRVASEA
jgi:hypothetical protein